MVAFGSVIYAFSVFVTRRAAGAEFSTTVLAVAYGSAVLVGGGLAWLVGRYADRRGVRGLVALGATLGGLGMATVAVSSQPWQLVAAGVFLLGPGLSMTSYEPMFVAVGQMVPPSRRARAVGLVTLVGGIAGPLYLPLTGDLIGLVGWRLAALWLGAVYVGVGLAVAAFFLPGRPGSGRAHASTSIRTIARDRRYHWYSAGTLLSSLGIQAVLFHRVAAFEEAGFPVTTVVGIAGLAGLAALPSRYLVPALTHRIKAPLLQVIVTILLAGAALLALGTTRWSMAGHFLVFGAAFGSLLPLRAIVMDGWYAGADFGGIMGFQRTLGALVASIGPWLVGIGHLRWGGYEVPMIAVAAVFVMSAACTARAAKPLGRGAGARFEP